MAVSRPALKRRLASDEPNYAALADSIDDRALGWLAQLARDADPLMAAKATHLASLVSSPMSARVIEVAAQRDEPSVRVAAAAALSNIFDMTEYTGRVSHLAWAEYTPDIPAVTLRKLLRDPDPGVRKFAARSASRVRSGPAVKAPRPPEVIG